MPAVIDMRVRIGWSSCLKCRKLIDKVGFEGPYRLLALWEYCAIHHQQGVFNNLKKGDVAYISNWSGDITQEEFLDVLIELDLLDELDDGEFAIHDFSDHQGFITTSKAIADAKSEMGDKRWAEYAKKASEDGELIKKRRVKNKVEHASSYAPTYRPDHTEPTGPTNEPAYQDPEPISKGIHGENDVDRVNFERDRRLEKQVEADYRDNPPEDDLSF